MSATNIYMVQTKMEREANNKGNFRKSTSPQQNQLFIFIGEL